MITCACRVQSTLCHCCLIELHTLGEKKKCVKNGGKRKLPDWSINNSGLYFESLDPSHMFVGLTVLIWPLPVCGRALPVWSNNKVQDSIWSCLTSPTFVRLTILIIQPLSVWGWALPVCCTYQGSGLYFELIDTSHMFVRLTVLKIQPLPVLGRALPVWCTNKVQESIWSCLTPPTCLQDLRFL